MARELFSDRAGNPRALSDGDFIQLLWQQYQAMRQEQFFGAGMSGDAYLADGNESPLSEAALIRVFKVSGLRY